LLHSGGKQKAKKDGKVADDKIKELKKGNL
jgi:hypothetical protein